MDSEMTTWWDLKYYIKSTNNPNYQLFLLRLFTRDSQIIQNKRGPAIYWRAENSHFSFLLQDGVVGRQRRGGYE